MPQHLIKKQSFGELHLSIVIVGTAEKITGVSLPSITCAPALWVKACYLEKDTEAFGHTTKLCYAYFPQAIGSPHHTHIHTHAYTIKYCSVGNFNMATKLHVMLTFMLISLFCNFVLVFN